MAPMKRPAAAAATPAAKKPRASGNSKKLASVSKVIKSAESYPQEVRAMLCEHMELTLGLAKEERHEFQARVVEMMVEVVTSVDTALEERVQAAKQKVAESDTEKVRRETEQAAAVQDVAAKTEAAAAAKATDDEATAAMQAASTALHVAKSEQKSGDAALKVTEEKKARLDTVMAEAFVPLQQMTVDPAKVKEAVGAVAKLGKDLLFDAALLTSLPSALSKAERGNFDQLVLSQVEAELQRNKALYQAELDQGEPGQKARADKVSAAEAELASKTAAQEATAAALASCVCLGKEAEDTLKAKNKSVKAYGADMRSAKAELAEAVTELCVLREGALADLKELAERSIHPPEPEVQPEAAEPAVLPAFEAAPELAA